MPPVTTVGGNGIFSLTGAGRGSGMGRVDVHQSKEKIIARFISQDSHGRSFLASIGTVVRCCVKPCLISGEGITLNHCGVEKPGIRKW